MAGIEGTEPLAGALIEQRDAPFTTGLLDQADGIFARFDGFGRPALDPTGSLLEGLIDRWALPERLENGLELFDLHTLGDLTHSWSARTGYFDAQFGFDGPFVVPVDPEQPVPLDAARVRRSRGRRPAGALRPMAPRRAERASLAETVADRWAVAPTADAVDEGFEHFDGAIGAALVEPVGEADLRPAPAAERTAADRSRSSAARPAKRPDPAPRADTPAAARAPSIGAASSDPAVSRPAVSQPAVSQPAVSPSAAGPAAGRPPETRYPPVVGVAHPGETAADALRPVGVSRMAETSRSGGLSARDALPDSPVSTPTGARPTPSTRVAAPTRGAAALARQRWRAVGETQLTPYPRAMGRAGAIEAGLLRFPEARARLGGARPAVFAAPVGVDLMRDGAGLAPASRGAERLVRRLFDTLVPVAEPVGAWLVPMLDALTPLADPPSVMSGAPVESTLASRAPTAELVVPDALRPPPGIMPSRTTAMSRPRLDGRLALPDRAPQSAARRAAAPDPQPSAVAAESTATSVMAARERAAVGERLMPAAGTRAFGPIATAEDAALPAAVRAALALTGTSVDASRERPLSTSGARAWLGEALGRSLLGLTAAPAPVRRAGLPGAAGATARALAERLATSVGEPALLADRAMAASIAPWAGVLVEPTADLSGATASAAAPDVAGSAARAAERAMDPGPAAGPAPAAGSTAGVAERAAGIAAATTRDSAGGRPPARADAASWASRIVQRLAVEPGATAALEGVVGRIADRLAGGTLLADTLARFEAADSPVERARAWRAVVDEAGLDPSAAALVEPVADRVAGAAATRPVAAGGSRARTAPGTDAGSSGAASAGAMSSGALSAGALSAGAVSPEAMSPSVVSPNATSSKAGSPGPASRASAAPGAAGAVASGRSPGAAPLSAASRAASTAGRAPDLARRVAGRADRAARPGSAHRPGDLARAAAALGSEAGVFERRMGLSAATRPQTLPEGRRWVIDPSGERWLVPLAGAPVPSTPDAASRVASPSAGAPGAASAATVRLAERIVSGLVPEASRSLTAAAARVLTRMAPAAADAWVASGFDPLALPVPERALLRGAPAQRGDRPAAVPLAATPDTAARSSAAPMPARPGALGAAVARLAERVVERPGLTTRRGGTPAGRLVEPGAPSRGVTAGAPSGMAPTASAGLAGRAPASPFASSAAGRPSRPSSMDPAALVAAGATAPESRMPARLRQWAALGDGGSTATTAAYGDAATPVMVAPGGSGESAGPDGSAGSTTAGSGASIPGARTVAAALRAFDSARVGNGSKAPALGRPTASAADVGQLVAAAMIREAPGGRLFGDRGPLAVTPPGPASRVYIETGKQASGEQPLRSTGESAGSKPETNTEARHRLASQTEGDLSPEELDQLATEVITQLRRELEFEGARFGEDEWD